MTADAILTELNQIGVELNAVGDRLRYRPKDAVPADLLERMKDNKADLLAALHHQQAEALAAAMPAPKRGHILELVLIDGRWGWRQRREDQADRAMGVRGFN